MSARPSPRALPYGVIAGRLFVPVDARLEPECTADELREKVVGDVLVLHPTAGLVGYESGDALHVSDLLARPPERGVAWDRARPGVAPPPRLISVEVDQPLSVETALQQGGGDIGSQPISDLPAAPNEPGNSLLHRAGRYVAHKAAQAMHWVAGLVPPRPSGPEPRPAAAPAGQAGSPVAGGPGWFAGMRAWIWQQLAAVTAAMQAARERELHRLLHMLRTNPDEGLRYAMPMHGSGVIPSGPPGTRLLPQDPNFNLSDVSGYSFGDPWCISREMRERLIARYRAVADRELRLGRHRRAAYIYAKLLADYASAAAVLEQGRHFREAAVLYRDRLRRPLDAARCLERAAMWAEAVAIYEAEQEFEAAGDLYMRLERRDEAEAAYRQAVAKLQARDDVLAAARLLENKLQAHDEALELLAAAWPGSKQAGLCLDARFDLLGRLCRHDDSRRLVDELRAATPPAHRVVVLAQSLGGVARRYPDRPVRTAAADATRVVAGRRLPAADATETEALVRAVIGLAPEDRLLARDGLRYRTHRDSKPKPATPRPARSDRRAPVLVRKLHLPPDVTWRCAAAAGEVFWAAGVSKTGLVVVRSLWDGTQQRVEWNRPVDEDANISLAPDPTGVRPTWIRVAGMPDMPIARLPATEAFPRAIHVGSPSWFTPQPIALAYGESGVPWSLHLLPDGLTLMGRHADGVLRTTRHLSVPAADVYGPDATIDAFPPRLLALRDTVYVSTGNHLLTLVRDEPVRDTEFPSAIIGLVGTWPLIRPRNAVTHERGGFVVWGGLDRGHMQSFSDDLPEPVAGFTREGTLVAVTPSLGTIYDTHDRVVVARTRFAAPLERPIAILPTHQRNEFALCLPNGEIGVFRIPD